MNKEYIFTLTVDGEETPWKVVVTDDEVLTYEGDTQTNKMAIKTHEKNVLQIDRKIDVFGNQMAFQLEREIPYLKVEGKWIVSDTTYEDRKNKILKNQKVGSWMQIGFCAIMAAACGIRQLVTGDMGSWWFGLIVGSIMGITGAMQLYNLKKEFGV